MALKYVSESYFELKPVQTCI